jgi:hypothetical protein
MNKKYYLEEGIPNCLYLMMFMFILVSCANNEKKDSFFTINGQFNNSSGNKILLQELDLQDIKTVDSAWFDPQGKFRLTYELADQGFYLLKLPDGRFITLLLNRGENLTISGDIKRFPREYSLTGSNGSRLLKEFYDHTGRNKDKGDSLMDVLRTHQYSDDYFQLTLSFDTLFQNIWQDQKKFEKNFIDRNINSLSSLLVLNYSFGPRPVLSEDEDFSYYFKVDSSLMKAFPLNKHVIYHHKRIAEYQRQKEANALESEKLQHK